MTTAGSLIASFRQMFGGLLKIKSRTKPLVLWGAVFIGLILIFLALYLPALANYRKISDSLRSNSAEIEKAKAAGLSTLNPVEIGAFQKRTIYFKKSLMRMSQAPSVLDAISDKSEANHVHLVSINAEALVPLMNESGGEWVMNGSKISQLPIHVYLQGSAVALTEFLASLMDPQLPMFVVDRYVIKKTSEKSGSVGCDLTLSFFTNG